MAANGGAECQPHWVTLATCRREPDAPPYGSGGIVAHKSNALQRGPSKDRRSILPLDRRELGATGLAAELGEPDGASSSYER
jgi:hypothetical protein